MHNQNTCPYVHIVIKVICTIVYAWKFMIRIGFTQKNEAKQYSSVRIHT